MVDNVAAIPVEDAWITRQVWRAADGSELPVRRPPRSFVIVTES